jgi:serine/threonine protein kinase
MLSTTKHKGVPYLPYDDFSLIYPQGDEIASGSYGTVYQVGSLYAVKEIWDKNALLLLAQELDIYARYNHPCIMKPLYWSINKDKAYLVMWQGKDLIKAYKDKDITMQQIISDTLSAFAFLNSQGIAHCDIKPRNMVLLDGVVKVIDFGLARRGQLGPDGQYYITKYAYTSPFIDPEYVEGQENNINSEIPALVMSYAQILDLHLRFGDLYIFGHQDKDLNWLFIQGSKFSDNRPSMQILLDTAPDSLIVRQHEGSVFEAPVTEEKCEPDLRDVLDWVVDISYDKNFSSRNLFLILHLIRRVYFPLMEEFLTKLQSNNSVQKDNLSQSDNLPEPEELLEKDEEDIIIQRYLIGAAAISLVGYITRTTFISGEEWATSETFKEENNIKERHEKIMLDILINTGGIISTLTYWDYADSGADLMPLLEDILNCRYNPSRLREIGEISNKCITVQEMFENFSSFKEERKRGEKSKYALPCLLDIKSDYREVEYLWDHDNPIVDNEGISILLHNRKDLHKLDLNLAIKIYKTFLNKIERDPNRDIHIEEFVMRRICGYNWEKEQDDVLAGTIHPFKMFPGRSGEFITLLEYEAEERLVKERRKNEERRRQEEYLEERRRRREAEEDMLVEEARWRQQVKKEKEKKKFWHRLRR